MGHHRQPETCLHRWKNHQVKDFGEALASFSKDKKPLRKVEVGRSGVLVKPGLHSESWAFWTVN